MSSACKYRSYSLGAALHQTRQCPDALHIDELCGEGWICRQLSEFFQSLQASIDTMGLDPLQKLTSSTRLSATKQKKIDNEDELTHVFHTRKL